MGTCLPVGVGVAALWQCVASDECRGRLGEGHSIIVPTEHVASTRQVDEHIWTELRNFKKCLLQMHMAQVPTLLLDQHYVLHQVALVYCMHCDE